MVFQIINIICSSLILFGLLWLLLLVFLGRKHNPAPQPRPEKEYTYCVLIPARYESAVIEDLLVSIEKQSLKVRPENIYIIVESEKDDTVKIAAKHNVNIFVRRNLNEERKGYALDECVKYLSAKKLHFDAYFIFDADNVLDSDFFLEMDKSYKAGYYACTGYRNAKNGNDNAVAACSALTFTMINTIGNRIRSHYNRNIVLSGTGYYIAGSLVEKWQGFPFHSLTEDYEESLYLTVEKISTHYNESAVFYDEQPTAMDISIKQRTRWVKGYFCSRKIYIKKIVEKLKADFKNNLSLIPTLSGIKPLLIIVIAIIIEFFNKVFVLFIHGQSLKLPFHLNIPEMILLIYLVLVLITIILFISEKGKLDISISTQVKACFFNPFFLASYVYCVIVALFSKNIEWERIEHKHTLMQNEPLE